MSDQKEMQWRGERIVQVPYTVQPFNKADAFGFTVKEAYVVRDGLDEPCLPLSQQWFWSPGEAIAAIEMRDTLAPLIRGPKWPSTVMYEYNLMVTYRRNFHHVYDALVRIRKACDESRDFDENPRAEIEKILHALRQNIQPRAAG